MSIPQSPRKFSVAFLNSSQTRAISGEVISVERDHVWGPQYEVLVTYPDQSYETFWMNSREVSFQQPRNYRNTK